MGAPALAPKSEANGHGNATLAEAAQRHQEAADRVKALKRQRDTPASTLERLQALRDLPQAEIDEQLAHIAVLEASEAEQAARRQRQAAAHAEHDPLVRAAFQAYHVALERIRDSEYAGFIAALEGYQAATGNSHRHADAMHWPPAVFDRPQFGDEDPLRARRRYLREAGLVE